MEHKRLYIPVPIRRNKELISGFGMKELGFVMGGCGIGCVIGAIILMITSIPGIFYMLFPVITGIFTFFLVSRNDCNKSVLDAINIMIRFCNEQQKYNYCYHNIYEKEKSSAEKAKKGEGNRE